MTNKPAKMNVEELVAIDVHTHAEISVRDPAAADHFSGSRAEVFQART